MPPGKAPPLSASDAQTWLARARLHRRAEEMADADHAMDKARTLAPRDPQIAFLYAQIRYERGYPASRLFAHALALAPGNRDALRNLALAEASEGRMAQAQNRLERALAQAPDWLEGQRILASLRHTGGAARDEDAGYRAALTRLPAHPGLWLGLFACVAQHRDWSRARAILDEATRNLGETKNLLAARLFLAGETGDMAASEALLARAGALNDAFVQMARLRHHLRRGAYGDALAIALPLLSGGNAGQVWPYVSSLWRLTGDARAAWLDGDPPHVGTYEPGLSAAELAELAKALRRLHVAHLPYAEQSVRHGTQTDRSVLLRHEPIFEQTRARLMASVREHVRALPAPDPDHPLLGRPRDALSLAGSWSVRLGAGGHNVTHSHPMGWLSSAFYVSLPDPSVMGAPPAGHLHLGAPPSELGLPLAPYATLEPKAGHLVLFASTMWHGTTPIDAGERLNIAFDIVPR